MSAPRVRVRTPTARAKKTIEAMSGNVYLSKVLLPEENLHVAVARTLPLSPAYVVL